MKPLISFVVPVLNEVRNVDRLHAEVGRIMSPLADRYEWEFVFTDNRSSDGTFERLVELAGVDSRIAVFRFSKNYGYQKSILTGYRMTRGAAAVQLDCDLQDPPELIPQFLDEWEKGARVVYGVRTRRKESWPLETARKGFYRLITWLSDGEVPADAGDFRLLDRVVLEQLKHYRDERPYLRGHIARMGFRQVGIPYERNARTAGESKFGWTQLVGLAVDGILSQSVVPLRMATYFGLAVSVASVLGAAGYAVARLTLGTQWPAGFTTLALLVLFGIGINALFLGVIGEYLARVFRQLKCLEEVLIEQAHDARPELEERGVKR